MANDDTEYDLVLPFDTDDPQFVRGWQLGELIERLRHEPFAEATICAQSAEMVIRIAELNGCSFTSGELGDGWIHVTLQR
jgi:hypothetical protein